MKEKNPARERPDNETYRHDHDSRDRCPRQDLDRGGRRDARSDQEIVFQFPWFRRLIAAFWQMDTMPTKRHGRSVIVPEPVRDIVRVEIDTVRKYA